MNIPRWLPRASIPILAVLAGGCNGVGPTSPEPCPEAAFLIGPILKHPSRGLRAPIRPDAALRADPASMQALQGATEEVNSLTGLRLYIEADPSAPFESVQIFIHLIPGQTFRALEADNPDGGAVITIRDLESARRGPILTHELLHWVGLKGHSPIPTEVMCGEGCEFNRMPSAREKEVLRWLMAQPEGPIANPCWKER